MESNELNVKRVLMKESLISDGTSALGAMKNLYMCYKGYDHCVVIETSVLLAACEKPQSGAHIKNASDGFTSRRLRASILLSLLYPFTVH